MSNILNLVNKLIEISIVLIDLEWFAKDSLSFILANQSDLMINGEVKKGAGN